MRGFRGVKGNTKWEDKEGGKWFGMVVEERGASIGDHPNSVLFNQTEKVQNTFTPECYI